jgi:hypothetical protein
VDDVMKKLDALEKCLRLLSRVVALSESHSVRMETVEQKLRWTARELARQIWMDTKQN